MARSTTGDLREPLLAREAGGMYRERGSRIPGAVVWSWAATAAATRNRVLPDGCMDLLWHNGELLVAGPDTQAYVVSETEGAHYTGLRFAPGTAPAVLGVPAHELRNQRVPLAALWPERTVRPLAERVAAAPERENALEAVVAERLSAAPPPDPLCGAVVTALRGGSTVADTARAAGLSERQLHRRSLAAFGYGPKTLAKVLRLGQALELARSGVGLATVAVTAGYADQSHLAHDIKVLTGVPLRALTT
ncbi:DUF6597 domain-containing transcriptional factor [Amycolatopsis nigrescens]|uniref:DUF6597 domain-containing transcriptional factor n=1 Tax=Amycolatopsis nigrescens TaxID=381445 RepID=UPI0003759670|nr:DUF6597 domain-containing transcriptional factor [Amycolatopsis nigrescens]